jgi:hypothetical protein
MIQAFEFYLSKFSQTHKLEINWNKIFYEEMERKELLRPPHEEEQIKLNLVH